jgi:hypothetical protein
MRVIALGGLTLTCALGANVLAASPRTPAAPAAMRLEKTIPLAGVEGRIDHLAIDTAGRRLFVCALGNGTMEVLDLETGQRVQSVPGFKEPQGVAFIPRTKTVVIASGGDGRQIVASLDTDADTDDVFYDAARQRLYAICGAGSVVVYQQVDADHYQEQARITTAGGARTGLFSPELGRLFVAVPHRANPVAEIRVFATTP